MEKAPVTELFFLAFVSYEPLGTTIANSKRPVMQHFITDILS